MHAFVMSLFASYIVLFGYPQELAPEDLKTSSNELVCSEESLLQQLRNVLRDSGISAQLHGWEFTGEFTSNPIPAKRNTETPRLLSRCSITGTFTYQFTNESDRPPALTEEGLRSIGWDDTFTQTISLQGTTTSYSLPHAGGPNGQETYFLKKDGTVVEQILILREGTVLTVKDRYADVETHCPCTDIYEFQLSGPIQVD